MRHRCTAQSQQSQHSQQMSSPAHGDMQSAASRTDDFAPPEAPEGAAPKRSAIVGMRLYHNYLIYFMVPLKQGLPASTMPQQRCSQAACRAHDVPGPPPLHDRCTVAILGHVSQSCAGHHTTNRSPPSAACLIAPQGMSCPWLPRVQPDAKARARGGCLWLPPFA